MIAALLLVLSCTSRGQGPRPSACEEGWSQWGLGPAHAGTSCAAVQPLTRILADLVVDPFVLDERAEAGDDLLGHYQAPLLAGDDVFLEAKSGDYVPCNPPGGGQPAPCGPAAWDRQLWMERKYRWNGGALELRWRIASDWKPPPNAGHLNGWEPVFHAALGPTDLWVPAAGGAVLQVDRETGALRSRVDPFGGDPSSFVAGPITVDAAGNALWTVIRFTSATSPWTSEAHGALVRAGPAGGLSVVSFDGLVPGAPGAGDGCETSYAYDRRRPPPLPLLDGQGGILPAPQVPCGNQRPQLNAAPAVGRDGTIFLVSRAHRGERASYLVALDGALAVKWAASFRQPDVQDGCGVTVPTDGQGGNCLPGVPAGIDPDTGAPPAQRATDQSTASPVALPDGSVLIGTYAAYNGSRGHLFRLDRNGQLAAVYDFGWDTTPAFFEHDGTWSIVLKDNHYDRNGPYLLTQLSADLAPEWSYANTNHLACVRGPDGSVACADNGEHPQGFEWCVNAIVVDRNGVVLANSEDGNLYAIEPGGQERQHLFLGSALGAAYTPLALDAKGRVYTQNAGHLYVIGGD